jgi:hypothetical protein
MSLSRRFRSCSPLTIVSFFSVSGLLSPELRRLDTQPLSSLSVEVDSLQLLLRFRAFIMIGGELLKAAGGGAKLGREPTVPWPFVSP